MFKLFNIKCILGAGVGLSLVMATASCGKKDKADTNGSIVAAPPLDQVPSGIATTEADATTKEQVAKVESIIKEHQLYRYPTITAYLFVRNAERTSEKIEEAGGNVRYNPNLSGGSQVPFLIADIPPRKLLDKTFIAELDLRAIQIENPRSTRYKISSSTGSEKLSALGSNLTVPIRDINVHKLEQSKINGGKLLGEDVTVAVIDTGIDASHPTFQDRVVYWSDQTEETQVALTEANSSKGKVIVKLAGEEVSLDVPKSIQGNALYVGVIREAALAAQVSGDEKRNSSEVGLDLNLDGQKDGEFSIVVGTNVEGETLAFVDTSGNGKIAESKELDAIVDFNEKRATKNTALKDFSEFVQFNFRSRTIKYPLMLLRGDDEKPEAIRLGMSSGSHGTHVAGIIGGNGLGIKGAAPKAKFMAFKVCSGISCTTDAIIRAMVEAFYNPQGIIPDVVNVSLGSHQQYSQDVMDFLMQDLTAKFGTVFVVSASNSGPGYRSLNSIASFGPTIQVGAHASLDTLKKLYTLDDKVAEDMVKNQLLFFSSAGPSYTGHLRPNIIAPGAALSSTTLADNGVDMYNGTSMSSPIVAGSVAALLSVAKSDPLFEQAKIYREAKVQSILKESNGEATEALPYSLKGYAIAIRTALENTTTKLPQYTMAQQGHGLINVSEAYEAMIPLVSAYAEEKASYFDVTLNGNRKSSALYNRNGSPKKSVEVTVGLVEDAEMSEEERLTIKTLPITVKLEKVEVQSTNGEVKLLDLDGKLPFALASRGAEGKNSKTATIHFGTSRKLAFISLRKTELMEPSKTYLAHYAFYQKGVRIQSVLDVVHVPVELPKEEQSFEIPSLSNRELKHRHAFAKSSETIEANAFHRYPILVTEEDTELEVSLGIPFKVNGALFLQVYDPTGNEVDFKAIHRSSELDPGMASSASIKANTVGKAGIYEVTVAASYWRRYSASKYDLLVKTDRLSINKKNLVLSLGSSNEVLRLSHPYAAISSAKGGTVELEASEALDLKTVPGLWTYHKISIPNDAEYVTVEVAPWANSELTFFGSIVPSLFSGVESGNPEVLTSANPGLSSDTSVLFEAPGTHEAYIAVENFGVLKENGSLTASTKLPIRVVYGGSVVGEVEIKKSPSSSKNEALFRVIAPDSLSNDAKAASGVFKMQAGQRNLSVDITIK